MAIGNAARPSNFPPTFFAAPAPTLFAAPAPTLFAAPAPTPSAAPAPIPSAAPAALPPILRNFPSLAILFTPGIFDSTFLPALEVRMSVTILPPPPSFFSGSPSDMSAVREGIGDVSKSFPAAAAASVFFSPRASFASCAASISRFAASSPSCHSS